MIPQVRALKRAQALVPKLPHGTIWAFTVTSDDDCGEMSPAFNVFVPDLHAALSVHDSLQLGEPSTIGSDFATYRSDCLLVSIIQGVEP